LISFRKEIVKERPRSTGEMGRDQIEHPNMGKERQKKNITLGSSKGTGAAPSSFVETTKVRKTAGGANKKARRGGKGWKKEKLGLKGHQTGELNSNCTFGSCVGMAGEESRP